MFAEIQDRTGHKLIEKYGSKDGTGIIGGRVLRKGGSPVSKPSGIYWSALRTWGLLAPMESTGAAPHLSDLKLRWDVLTRRDRPEVDARSSPYAIFDNPPPIPDDWTRKKGELAFDLDPANREGERIRLGWSRLRDPDGNHSLLSRLAEQGKFAPPAMNSAAVRKLCSATEALKLDRAERAASLVCLARALYIAMVGDLKRSDGATVGPPDQMLASALTTHKTKALALDINLLEADVPALGELKPLLVVVQNWAARNSFDYRDLQPTFLKREHALKGDRALLLSGSDDRRKAWEPSEPRPLTFRWDKVSSFLDELAPAA
jgi:hypothetical protein